MNEVRIIVRTTNAAKAGFEEVSKDIDKYAKEFADSFTKNFSRNLNAGLTQNLTNHLRQVGDQAEASARAAGDRIGDTIGRNAGQRILDRIRDRLRGRGSDIDTNGARSGGLADDDRDKVKVDVDVDRQSFLSKMGQIGKEGSSRFGDAFKTGFMSIFSGDLISTVLKGSAVVALAAGLSSIISTAVVSGVLLAFGGGAIAAGVALAMKDPRIKIAIGGIGRELKEMGDTFGRHFRGPLEDFLAPSNKGGGGLIGVIESMKPLVDHLGTVLAPLAGKLGDGIIGFLQNLLPAAGRAIEGSAPVLESLANKLPGLGEDIAYFLDQLTDKGPEAAMFFDDLMDGIGLTIRTVGRLINIFASMYDEVRMIVLMLAQAFINSMMIMLTAAEKAFGWIPGLGPKLRGAQDKFAAWSESVTRQINKVPDSKTFTLRFRIVGLAAANAAIQTARILDRMGFAGGGAVGQAASGGPRSGRVWVGEHGPELVDLAPGSTVHSAGDSRRMAAGQGGQQQQIVGRLIADRTTERGLVDMLMDTLRLEIRDNFGGSAQLALGS